MSSWVVSADAKILRFDHEKRVANQPAGRRRHWLHLEELSENVRNVYCERNLSAGKTGFEAETLFHPGLERPSAPRRGGCDPLPRHLFTAAHPAQRSAFRRLVSIERSEVFQQPLAIAQSASRELRADLV